MKQGGEKAGGFTIVEVLIVLVVTSALLVSAVLLVGGRQNRTQFMTGINSFQQELQQVINETASGYYPSRGDFVCSGNATGAPTFTSVGAGSAQQGTNGGCIFLGKVVAFGTDTDKSKLGIVPIVGNQTNGSSASLTVASSNPRAIYPATGEGAGYVPSISVLDVMQNGLTVAQSNTAAGCPASPNGIAGMCYISSLGVKTPTGAIAFLAGDSTGNLAATDGNNLQSGTQQLSLYGVKSASPNKSLNDTSQAVGNYIGSLTSNLEVAQSASICIASATTKQSGLITIDSGLNVTLQVKDGSTC